MSLKCCKHIFIFRNMNKFLLIAVVCFGSVFAFAQSQDSTLKNTEPTITSQPTVLETKEQEADSAVEQKSQVGLMNILRRIEPDEAVVKGNFFGGVTLFLLHGNTDDDVLNVLIGDIYDAEGYTFSVEGFGGYFLKDALGLGLRAGYSRTMYDIDFELLEDLLEAKERRKYVSNGFFVQPILRNYLKILDSKNIYFFNETSFTFEYSYGISQVDDGEDMGKTRNRSWSFELGINPGVSIMILDNFAFETSVGLLGLSSSIIEIEENGEKHSEFSYNMVNFTVNLLALDLSLVYFF